MSPCHPVTRSLRRSLVRSDLPALALLLGLILLFFWKLAFTNLIIARGDIFYYFYPYRDYAASALRDGRIPLWNPYLFMGAPFLANSQVGFFYPFNLLMSWLDTARAINWTIVLHIFMAASGVYVFARRRLGLSILAGWLAAVSFGLGGYLGTQIEHVNQLQGLAWIGWIFLVYEAAVSNQQSAVSSQRSAISHQPSAVSGQWSVIRNALILSVLIAVQLLAGHTQAVYITLFGLGIYAAWPALELIVKQPRRVVPTLAARLWPILVASILAVGLSAIQLLPTLELTRLSARGGGLPTNLAVSFSLDPRLLGRALLPDYAGAMPAGGEFTSFFSVAVLFLMVIGGLSFWLKRRAASNLQLPTARFRSVSIVAVLGLVLAFGGYTPIYYVLLKVVPGLDLFRAPARWLVLFVFAGSLLAGVGFDAVRERRVNWKSLLLPIAFVAGLIALAFIAAGLTPAGASGSLGSPDTKSLALWLGMLVLTILFIRFAYSKFWILHSAFVLLCCLDLFLATRPLPYNSRATAPDALTSLRPAVTHLEVGAEDHTPPDRFLSISDIQFDPGDSAELKSIYGDQLPAEAFYDLIVATKAKEIVAPNLPLYYHLPAVDGYDGGLLPLKNYMTFQQLFLDPNLIQSDGRLREQLKSIPDARWLDLMNARYIITDKVGDQWYDGVLYDLQFATRLGVGDSAYTDQVPRFNADVLGIVYSDPMTHSVLAQVEVAFADGLTKTLILADEPITTTNGVSVARLTWGEPRLVNSIRVTGAGGLTIHGVALIDQRSQSFQSFVLAPHGDFRLAHSGDVKVYENAAVLPRAFVVSDVRAAANDDEAIALMQGADFDPSRTVVLFGQSISSDHSITPSPCRLVPYTPEYAAIEVDAAQDGYLVLTDAYYPGWVATIDGQPADIKQADVMFRAVKVPMGQHRVEMRYEPQSFKIGVGITLGVCLVLIAGLVLAKTGLSQGPLTKSRWPFHRLSIE